MASKTGNIGTALKQAGNRILTGVPWLKGSRAPAVAIDVDGKMMRVVQTITRPGPSRISRFAARQLELDLGQILEDPDRAGAAIQKALQDLRWKPRQVVMGVPRALTVLRTLTLPQSADEGELASMVHFQVGKDLPFPREDAIIDFKVQGAAPAKDPAGSEGSEVSSPQVQVLAVAVQRRIVQAYQRIAEVAGFQLAALGLRSYANARCVQACTRISPEEYVALVSLRSDEVIIDVLEEKFLVFSRAARVPILEADGLNQAVIEVVRSLHSFAGEPNRGPITKTVIAGNTGKENDICQLLNDRLPVPCQILDPARQLGLSEVDHPQAPGALAAFGLGLGFHDPDGLPFDFAHPRQPASPEKARRRRQLLAAAAGLVFLITFLGVRHHLIQKHTDRYNDLVTEVNAQKEKSPIYRTLQAQARSVRQWTGRKRPWLHHLAHLSQTLPSNKDIYLTSVSIHGGGSIQFNAQVRNGDIVADLDKRFREAGYQIDPLPITPTTDKHGYPFRTSALLNWPAGQPLHLGTNDLQEGGAAP